MRRMSNGREVIVLEGFAPSRFTLERLSRMLGASCALRLAAREKQLSKIENSAASLMHEDR